MTKKDFDKLSNAAREANLADYFRQSGYSCERHGSEIYVKEFPGLCVNENTNQWYSHYEGVGGKNAVDCLVKIAGLDFKSAVFGLTGQDITKSKPESFPKKYAPNFTSPPKTIQKTENKELVLPEQDENMRRLFAHFCKERGIPAEILSALAHEKLMYQSRGEIGKFENGAAQKTKTCNAVFVHKNENGEVLGAEIQGINSFKRFKGVASGTGDSVFSFTPFPAKDGRTKCAYLFESAVDLMSFCAFCKEEKMQGVTLISMAGLKPRVPKMLGEQGIKVFSCVDNDDAGRKFESDNNFKRAGNMLEKAGVKDWNELLILSKENPEAVKNLSLEITKKNFRGGKK